MEAIHQAAAEEPDWLYQHYPKPGGQQRKSLTGFIMHEGRAYPVKPLGRLANMLAGHKMINNPKTKVFLKYFEGLDFQPINSMSDEADAATEREQRLAKVWARPNQAKFREDVFELFGARCLVTGCETLKVLEAAHVLPVSQKGGDEGWNGIPLRADLHRLFDAGEIKLEPKTWKLFVNKSAFKEYGQYHGLNVGLRIANPNAAAKLAKALKKRNSR